MGDRTVDELLLADPRLAREGGSRSSISKCPDLGPHLDRGLRKRLGDRAPDLLGDVDRFGPALMIWSAMRIAPGDPGRSESRAPQ
jgi:hypothetical protein